MKIITHEEISEIVRELNIKTNYQYKHFIKDIVSYILQQEQNELTLKVYLKHRTIRTILDINDFEEMKKLEHILLVNMGMESRN